MYIKCSCCSRSVPKKILLFLFFSTAFHSTYIRNLRLQKHTQYFFFTLACFFFLLNVWYIHILPEKKKIISMSMTLLFIRREVKLNLLQAWNHGWSKSKTLLIVSRIVKLLLPNTKFLYKSELCTKSNQSIIFEYKQVFTSNMQKIFLMSNWW